MESLTLALCRNVSCDTIYVSLEQKNKNRSGEERKLLSKDFLGALERESRALPISRLASYFIEIYEFQSAETAWRKSS